MNDIYNTADNLSIAQELLSYYTNNLPKEFDIKSIDSNSKLPFKVIALRESLLYRITDLSIITLQLFKDNKLMGSFILTRSIM